LSYAGSRWHLVTGLMAWPPRWAAVLGGRNASALCRWPVPSVPGP